MKKILITFLLLTTTVFAQQEFKDEFSQSAENIETVLVDCSHGRIFCEPSADNKITVHIKKVVYLKQEDDAKELAEACKVDYNTSGRNFEIEVDFPRSGRHKRNLMNKLFSLDFDDDIEILINVAIPPAIKFAVKTSSADISVSGINNDIDIRGSSADVSLEDIDGNCIIDLSSGDLEAFNINGELSLYGSSSDFELDGIAGAIDISTSSGDGIIDDINGNIKLKTSSGDIKIYNLEGDLDFSSTSGDLTAGNISGYIDAGSSSGTINLRRLTNKEGRYFVETTSGDVHLEVDPRFDGHLEIETISGAIDTYLDISLDRQYDEFITGSTGEGNGKIEIETSSGDVVLENY
ncbi:MAG: DUF4097 domain-containing protein [candidate division Zixibacteria bacterium]|nr:DUF4097 domain-containing protein [candidate division Zixibacteria bacterium]